MAQKAGQKVKWSGPIATFKGMREAEREVKETIPELWEKYSAYSRMGLLWFWAATALLAGIAFGVSKLW